LAWPIGADFDSDRDCVLRLEGLVVSGDLSLDCPTAGCRKLEFVSSASILWRIDLANSFVKSEKF
jgi:hypothetical protein